MRRRCVDLPPIPQELFLSKYDKVREELAAPTVQELTCPVTKRTFKTAAALEHFHSSKAYQKALEKANSRTSRAEDLEARVARGEAVPTEVRNSDGVVVDKVLYRVPTAEEDPVNPEEEALLRRDTARAEAAAATGGVLAPSVATAAESSAAALAGEEARRTGQLPVPTSAAMLEIMAEAGYAPDNLLHRPIPLRYSLFDRVGPFRSVKGCLDYMLREYGFHIPFVAYLTNLEGLMEYLGTKVGVGHTCVWCHKGFASLKDVQQHMRDMGHCMISLDDEEGQEDEDLHEYFEFTHTLDREANNGEDDNDEWLGDADAAATVANDGDNEEEEETGASKPKVMTDNADADDEDAKAAALPKLTKEERLQLRATQRLRTLQLLRLKTAAEAAEAEEHLNAVAAIPSAERALVERPEQTYKGILTFAAPRKRELVEKNELGELVFADGSVIGHRQYRHMYRQRQATTEERDPEEELEARQMRAALTNQYASLQMPGYAYTVTETPKEYSVAMEKQHREVRQRKLREENKQGINYNMILRRWFRHQVPK